MVVSDSCLWWRWWWWWFVQSQASGCPQCVQCDPGQTPNERGGLWW